MIRVTSFGSFDHAERDRYLTMMKRMVPIEWNQIPLKRCPDTRPPKLLPEEEKFLADEKSFVLLDAKGKSFDSDQFYRFCFQGPDRHFVIGPAIGVPPLFRERAEMILSLSPLTFTHGLAQLVFAESLFRAACQLKNHPFVK